jgi:glycosyltransferase involved in cell wall biosynthesis
MTSPTVSVVIPCYNADATVAETIESAFAAGSDVEVIAVDDGSTDATGAVLASYGDRIRVLSGPNRGVSAARNSGVAQAQGRFVQFLDSDDLLEPGTLDVRLDAAGEQHDLVICDWREFHVEDGRVVDGRLRKVDDEAIARDPEIAFATEVWAPPAAVLYRRELVDRIGGFRPNLPVIQDARHLFDAAHHGASIVHIDHVGARYRVLSNSLSRSNAGRFAKDLLVNTIEIGELWRAGGELSEQRRRTLMDMFNTTARALFAAGHADYPLAIEAQRELGLPLPLHSRLAPPLARMFGLPAAARLLRSIGRG